MMVGVMEVLATALLVALAGDALGARPGYGPVDVPPGFAVQMQSRAVDMGVDFNITEGQPIGTMVGVIPRKLGFTYRFNEPPKEFILDPYTGEIKTSAVLDRESVENDRYDLVVLSSQPTYPIEVRIAVTDINDNSPQFPEPSIAVAFSESAAAGTRLLLDAATDRDLGVNGIANDYRIIDGDSEGKFRLNLTANPSGQTSYLHLETTGKLDRESKDHYVLNISARDGGSPPKYGYLQVNVTILDVNDNPPIFDQSDFSVSLNESVAPGTKVLKVTATDSDLGENGKISYRLSENEQQFTVDPISGIISTAAPLNCQKYCNNTTCNRTCVLTVIAFDHGSPRQDARSYVTVNLIDANDHDPVITFIYVPSTANFATVDENAKNGSVVAAITVADVDEGLNGKTSVKIVSGNELSHFRLETSSSVYIVHVNGVLDREEISKYNLTVVATDKGTPSRTATAYLIIHVNDVNDHEPVFEKSEYSAILSELAPKGTYVAGIVASDEDSGVNAEIFYSFQDGNEHEWFSIDSSSGLVTTRTLLDREIQGTIELNVSARDGGPNPKWAFTQLKVTILDENDEAPKFSKDIYEVNLSENDPEGSIIVYLAASDHDQGTNGSVTYSLHPEIDQKYPKTFAIDASSGILRTLTKLDRETISNYEIRVIARDQGFPQQTSTATVLLRVLDINDNNPKFYPQQYYLTVSDDLPKGSSIVKINATDKDEGENAVVTYNLENGGDGFFIIDRWTGVIKLNSDFHHAQKPLYRLIISSTDRDGRKAQEDAIVEIVKRSFKKELQFNSYTGYEFQIVEDDSTTQLHIGRHVGKVQVQSSLEDVKYAIIYGDENKVFKIDEKTGRIVTAAEIDRETKILYNLKIIAKSGLASGVTSVNISVLDVNDNSPIFMYETDEIHIPENMAVGQEVHFARARDRDSGVNSSVTYSLTFTIDATFRISETTGVIYLNKPIRVEPGTVIPIEVTARDGGKPSLSSNHSTSIIIDDVNDHTPVFDHTSYETSLLESTLVNTRFFALSASDGDIGINGRISYIIEEGNGDNKFGIFPDGYLYVRSPLDREGKDYYALTITAIDHGIDPRFSQVPVVIHILDENDNAPKFTNETFSFSIRENEMPDTFVGKLTAVDEDIGRNAELTFSLASDNKYFTIDPKKGFIKTRRSFDREALVETTGQNYMTMKVTVTDSGQVKLQDSVDVTVDIVDVNDNAPTFIGIPYRVQISEGASLGTPVLRAMTTDADEGLNGDIFYKLIAGDDTGRFLIDEATGQISILKMLDREVRDHYSVTILAHDIGQELQLSSTTTVSIEVIDENDNSPEFTQTESRISVIETEPINQKIIQFHATDVDLGINAEITYSITSGNRRDTFYIEPLTGVLYLHKQLDYEDLTLYFLNITASDGGNPRLHTTTILTVSVIDANDNPPSFSNTAIVRQIREGIPTYTPIVTVTAEDPDSGMNGKVYYAISHQDPNNHKRHFDINNITGVIHTLLPIDRESIDTFRLTIVAYDRAEPKSSRLSAEKLVTVIVEDINDNSPIFVSMNAAVIPAEKLKQGIGRGELLIMHINARDLDSGSNGLVTYELQTENDIFHLHRSTGALTLKGMSYSVKPYWNLHVKAIDEAVQSEQRSTETYLTIIKGGSDSEGIIWSIPSSTSVPENEPSGTNVTVVSGQLPGTVLEYFITNVTAMGQQADRLFDIDPRLGIIFTAVPLDHESGNGAFEVEICAVAVNGRTRTFKTKILVEVLDKNDSPPVFRNIPLFYTASEDLAPGQPIATIEADDPDTIGHILYSIQSEEPTPFNLDETTGTLTLKDPLDRETQSEYELVIRASDEIQFTDVTVSIQVLDTNDNPPVFTESAYSLDVAEGAARGWRVGALSARDADAGLNARLSYFLVSDWANDVFSLNPHTGLITLTAKLDYEEVQHYILVAAAQDGGQPALSATVTVYVNVLDRNDNAPVFDPVAYSAEVLESAPLNTPALTVSATDLDSGDNGRVAYSITSGDDSHDFTVNDNGTVLTARLLDREKRALYSLLITARDCAEPPSDRLSSTVQVTIQLKDVNDMAPEFLSSNETSVMENVALNTVIMTIKAVDKDEGRNGYIEYFLTPDPATNGLFSLGTVDGLLRASGKLDRELKSSYVLSVTAKDRGDEPLMTKTDIYVTILDENDNSPVFDYRQYSAAVPENASIGANVLQVAATDIDEGANGRVRYSIASGDENRDFSISEDTGVVRVAKNLNYERKSRYNLMVRAEDCSRDHVRYDTAVLTISIQDINDNPPTFLDSPYLAFVMENVIPPNGGYVITVKAYDADTPPFNNQVRYFIKEGDADLFRINASTGQLSLTRTLDRETQAEYTLTLVAMDTGSPPLTGSGTVRIIVRDVNDNSPEFERQAYRATVNENLPYGTTIISPKAIDKDSGNNAKIRYSLLGDKVERFHIDQDTGIITSATVLDREENSFYTMTIMAQDSSTTDPRATTANLTIEVLDMNDNTPIFPIANNNIIIPESTDFGDFVFGARAVDSDIGLNSKIKYKISGEHASLFIINEDTGVIKAKELLFKHALSFDYSFKLTIIASDCGINPRENSSNLIVLMKPMQYFPKFINLSEMYFTLCENVSEGEMVTKLSAKSSKMGPAGNLQYGIAGGNVGDALRIDSIGGEIYVTGQGLDYETMPIYEAWFEVSDSDNPPLRTVLELKIHLTDANDNPPVMEKALYNISVLEEEPPPVMIIQITAKDDDSKENGEVSYELSNDYDGEFEIDSSNGEIYSTSRLDRESIPVYELVVKAIDNGSPRLTGTATVLVNLLDINDNPPRFTRLFSVNVTENAEFGSFVIKVTSSDQDLGINANATYSFTENPGEKFLIDSETGNVTVAGALDREQQDEYILKVVAVDGSWRAETPLTITIQDQNDNAPEFEHSFYSFNFPELQDNVTFVGQVIATDRDKQGPNSVISYSLEHPSELFTVDPASGEIFSKASIKYKQTSLELSPENIYSITVLATDNGKPPMSSECLVTINIVDANNNAPKFVTKEYLSPVPFESISGEMIVKVTAKDEYDSGINAEIDYMIMGGNATDHFAIDKVSGWVTLTNTFSEVGKTYKLVVKAIDRGVPPQSDEAVIIFVVTGDNIHSPVFAIVSYQVLVPENVEIGREIMNVSAVDEDDGPNGIVRYKISGGNERNEFDVDPVTGVIKNLQALDFDTIVEYHLNISATDLGFEPKEAMAMVTITLTDINDNAPFFNQTQYVAYLPENSEPNSLVYKITAYDKDSPINAIIRYSIMDSSSQSLFRINNETGEIFSKVSFDFEENNLYVLNIQGENPDSPMRNQTKVIVHITGVNEYYPKFVQSAFHFDVSESAEIGTHVGVIQATDQDSGEDGKVYYLFVGSSNDKGFSINPQTGVIRVSRSLDRETQNRVVLTVLAKNFGGIRGNDTDEAQVIISIQDGNDPPEFLQRIYEASVSEGANIGKIVTRVKAVDKDVRPQNNQFGYSIIGGNSDHSFKIDPQSGELEIARKLDRETISLYSLIVGAIDTGVPPQTGTATVRITLTDVNDNGPIFDPPEVVGYVSENEPPNTSVMTLTAKDPDLPPNGAPFSYTLVGGTHREMITIEKHTGIVRTTQSIDREMTPELNILVEVQDSGIPRQRTRHSIKIIIIDKNDSPSTPRSVHILVYAFNNLLPRGKIADVKPNDPDSSGDYYCKIIKDNNSEPEVLTIRRACDLYTSDVKSGQGYSLSVSGNDGKHPDVISTVTVEFLSFDNATVDESVTVLVNGMSSSKFLTKYYNSLIDIIKTDLEANDSIYMYSINEVTNGIQLMISLRQGTIIRSKSYVVNYLKQKETEINALLQTNIILPYIPCQYHSCNNDGICSDSISVHQDTRVTESQTLIITSPIVNHDFACQCSDGFTGPKCEKQQDPCSPNPCLSEGKCHKQGLDFYCTCPISKEGKLCELDRSDICTDNPCKNGGSCRQSSDRTSYFCLCRRGYRGNDCEAVVDSCRPNPCLNDGACISLKPGYKCSCPDGRYGKHCELSTYGFNELSYMTFPALDSSTNDISIIFATTKSDSLLIYNYGQQSGGRSDFVAVELYDGKAIFSFGGARTPITSVVVPGQTGNLADGNWHKVTATRNGRVVSLSVSDCMDHGDVCSECRPGDATCYADHTGQSGTLNFDGQRLLVGGLEEANPVLERPGQIHSDDFVGCLHSVSVNGRALNLSNPMSSRGIDPVCKRSENGPCSISVNSCGDYQCIDKWKSASCRCGVNLISPNCESALQPISISEGGYIEYVISQKHKRMQLLESIYRGTTLWMAGRNSVIPLTSNFSSSQSLPAKSISLLFRTIRKNGIILYAGTEKQYTIIKLIEGNIVYISKQTTVVNITMKHDGDIVDGNWHNITLYSYNRGVYLLMDDKKIGEELDSVGVHDFLDPELRIISLGGVRERLYREANLLNFEGCLANFSINNEVQPFNGSGSIFSEVLHVGQIYYECHGPIGVGNVQAPDPLSIGITLVIVFFVILIVAILVSFVVFRLRKQNKEKSNSNNKIPGMQTKLNGNTMIGGPNMGSLGNDNIMNRALQSNDTNVSGFISDNGEMLRNVGGLHIVGPELISKKYKEREIIGTEHQRSQRPDIIEREVVGKSPALREDHHPPPLPTSNTSHHMHDHTSGMDLNSDLPEHYDLENASSIAPSDIDIVYHYKGYREAGGVRKYKATPPPVATYHHKHQPAQHRHSPHHVSGFPARVPPQPSQPPTAPRQHQTTPLARLSPSSELSSQQPRILTLHDISGKPLQSALLATTSSSGGVGKDVLHSNSERSLNSPVMSQLSGQSSSASRKTPGAPPQGPPVGSVGTGAMGLTAGEIERLNARQRSSSLVSTLDAVSSSSEAPRVGSPSHHMSHRHHSPPEDNDGSTSTDESGNDSFTCSEIEYDNNSVNGDKYSKADEDDCRPHTSGNNSTGKPPPMMPPPYDAFDSSFRGSLSTLVASDDELSANIGSALYRQANGSPTAPTALGWDYLLNWGPNFESLIGVFKDIAELPDSVNGRVTNALRLPSGGNKPSEEYV